MKRSLLQLVCILALLAAQHGALTHAVWHAREHVPLQAQQHDHGPDDAGDERSSQADLCGLHILLGTVLGGAGASGAQFCCPPAAAEGISQRLHSRVSVEAVRFLSRGPPAPF